MFYYLQIFYKVVLLHIVLMSEKRYPDASFLGWTSQISCMASDVMLVSLYFTYTIKARCTRPRYMVLFKKSINRNGTDFSVII